MLAYMHGLYKSAITRAQKRQNLSQPQMQSINEGLFDKVQYPKYNNYGMQQRVNDTSGNEFAIQQDNGQWILDLARELQQLLDWKFIHGTKTVEATKAFIQLLNVDERGMFDFRKLKRVAAILGIAVSLTGAMSPNTGNQQMNQNNIEMTQQMNQNQTQKVDVSFQINSYEINPNDYQKIQSLPKGRYKIVVHNTQNKSGRDASYEQQLVQNRAQQIAKLLQGSQVSLERGSNVNGNMATAEIIPL